MTPYHPTPLQWIWWRVTIVAIIRAILSPERRTITPAECRDHVDDLDARMRAALSGRAR